jgi:hypothetical protein
MGDFGDKVGPWVRERIFLRGFAADTMWQDEHNHVARDWAANADARRLVAYMEPEGGALRLELDNVSSGASAAAEMMYFVRQKGRLTAENVQTSVMYGSASSPVLESLLRVMNGVYAPQVLRNDFWPESVKKDFGGQLHKFMASLTETAFVAQGKTVGRVACAACGCGHTRSHSYCDRARCAMRRCSTCPAKTSHISRSQPRTRTACSGWNRPSSTGHGRSRRL